MICKFITSGPMAPMPGCTSPVDNMLPQEVVLAADYDALVARVHKLLSADARGVIISSGKDAVYNHMEALRDMTGWRSLQIGTEHG